MNQVKGQEQQSLWKKMGLHSKEMSKGGTSLVGAPTRDKEEWGAGGSSEFLLEEAGRDGSSDCLSPTSELAKKVKKESWSIGRGKRRFIPRVHAGNECTLNKLNWLNVEMQGRKEETAELRQAFELFASKSRPEGDEDPGGGANHSAVVVSIEGVSGTGKTLLARSLRPAVERRSCFFVEGKFDWQPRVEPYTALLAAFHDLTEQILTMDEAFVNKVRERIERAVGGGAQVLIDFVPSLSKLLAEYGSSTTTGGGVDTIANRVQFIFRQFMRAVCDDVDGGQPVVILLEDMQWADGPTLALLEYLVCDVENPNLMLVTTSRSDEITDEHPFVGQLETFGEQGVMVQRMTAGNLDPDAVGSIVSKALRSSQDETKQLANLVHHKTHGNSFAVVQFMNTLVEEKILNYNFGTMAWSWNLEVIQAMDVTENVAGLMLSTLQKLRPDMQLTLQVASCLGQSFEGEILELVMKNVRRSGVFGKNSKNYRPVHDSLEDLVDAGLLERLSFSEFSFAHDLIKSAASNQIPEDQCDELRLHIGETLLKNAADKELNEHLFMAVELCNSAISLLGETERQGLAKYNLLAGEMALKKSAFVSAIQYMEKGLSCLGTDGWSKKYNLALDLSCGIVEAAYCSGNFETMQKHMDRVISSGGAFEGKIRVYQTRILSFGVQERFHDAVDTGLFVLKKMGMANFAKSPSLATVLKELTKTRLLLRKYSSESLCSLPIVGDEKRIQAMGIIMMMTSMAFISSPNLFVTMFLKAVRWSVKYGVCQYSPTAFATYGVLLIGVLGDVKEATMFGDVALALTARLEARETSSQTIAMIHGYNYHWTNGLHQSLKPLLYGHQVGMETGEVEMAMHNLHVHDIIIYVTASHKLDELSTEIEEHMRQMMEYKQEAFANFSRPLLQVLENLRGQSVDPLVLTGRAMNQEEMTQLAIDTNNRVMTVLLLTYRAQVAFLFGDYRAVVEYTEMSMDFGSEVMPGQLMAPRHFFYRGVAALALAASGEGQPKKNLRIGLQSLKMLQKWISNGNVNCFHMAKLLEAEIAALKKEEDAGELFGEAVLASAKSCYHQDKGLSHHRSGIYHLSKDDGIYWPAYHFDNAIQCYYDWGATALVDQLVSKYGDLVKNASDTSNLSRNLIEIAESG